MRLFHGKTQAGKWVKGFHLETQGKHYIVPEFTKPYKHYGVLFMELLIEVLPESVGQAMGLKDKEGVEIFKGDILSRVGFKGTFVVKWGHWGWRLEGTVPAEDRENSQWPPTTMPSGNFEQIEVIGNLTDTPALMEVE